LVASRTIASVPIVRRAISIASCQLSKVDEVGGGREVTSTMNGGIRDIARDYLKRGWSVIPVPYRDKKPIIDAWQTLRLTEDDLPRYFAAKSNIGGLNGEPSGWRIDVDLDHPIALEIADEYLPPTDCVFGRAGNPRSHRIYIVSSPSETLQCRFPKLEGELSQKMIIEFRSTTSQTVLPGSVHVSGELIEWNTDGEPAIVDPGELKAAVKAIAEEVKRRLGIEDQPPRSSRSGHSNHSTPDREKIVERCRAYVAKMDSAIAGQNGSGTAFNVACELFRFGLTDSEADGVFREYNERCEPPWNEKEIDHKLSDAREKVVNAGEFGLRLNEDRNGYTKSTSTGTTQQSEAASNDPPDEKPASKPQILTIGKLCAEFPQLRHPIIDGIIRRGDTANIIAPPKAGKSWCSYGIALSVATGLPWLGRFDCEPGRVLLIDNELFPSDIAWRIPRVAKALEIREEDYCRNLDVLPLRGKLMDLYEINRLLTTVESGEYSLVIFDAFYRGLPSGMSENDNAAIAGLFNLIDQTTNHLQAAWINIHHSSKGSQSGKSVVDVGAGAGSQSRAADAHLVLREHQEPGFAVLDGAVRTFPPIQPVALQWEWPLWSVALDLDPNKLAGLLTASEKKQNANDNEGMSKIIDVLTESEATESEIRSTAHIGRERCSRLIGLLEADDKITSVDTIRRGNPCKLYRLNVTLSTSADNVPDNQTT